MAMDASGEKGQLKLLGANFSPFVLRVRIALALKGIDYQFIEEDEDVMQNKSQLLLQSNPVHKKIPVLIHNGKPVCESLIIVQFIEENMPNKSQLLLQSNPVHKKIPVLIHKGNPICESMVIVQYIDEEWDTKAPNLLPKDPYDRAIARFWAAFVDDKLVPCLRGVFTGQGEQLQNAVEESATNFLLLEEALRTSRYFGGDEIGFVDIGLGGMLAFVKALQTATNSVLMDAEKMPLLSKWMDRFCEADGVKEVMPDLAKLVEFISTMRVRFASPPVAN